MHCEVTAGTYTIHKVATAIRMRRPLIHVLTFLMIGDIKAHHTKDKARHFGNTPRISNLQIFQHPVPSQKFSVVDWQIAWYDESRRICQRYFRYVHSSLLSYIFHCIRHLFRNSLRLHGGSPSKKVNRKRPLPLEQPRYIFNLRIQKHENFLVSLEYMRFKEGSEGEMKPQKQLRGGRVLDRKRQNGAREARTADKKHK